MYERAGVQYAEDDWRREFADYTEHVGLCPTQAPYGDATCGTDISHGVVGVDYTEDTYANDGANKAVWTQTDSGRGQRGTYCTVDCPTPTCDYDGVTYQLEAGPDAFPYSYGGAVIPNPATWEVPSDDELLCAVQAPAGDSTCGTKGTTPGSSELLTRTKVCKADGWLDTDVASVPELSCTIDCPPPPPTCDYDGVTYNVGEGPDAFPYSYGGDLIDSPATFTTPHAGTCPVNAPVGDPTCNTESTTPGSELVTRAKICTADGWNDTDTPSNPEAGCTVGCPSSQNCSRESFFQAFNNLVEDNGGVYFKFGVSSASSSSQLLPQTYTSLNELESSLQAGTVFENQTNASAQSSDYEHGYKWYTTISWLPKCFGTNQVNEINRASSTARIVQCPTQGGAVQRVTAINAGMQCDNGRWKEIYRVPHSFNFACTQYCIEHIPPLWWKRGL